jgi:hypothetical protein
MEGKTLIHGTLSRVCIKKFVKMIKLKKCRENFI